MHAMGLRAAGCMSRAKHLSSHQRICTTALLAPHSDCAQAINLASLQDPSGGPQTDSATTTITVTGCEGAQVSVGNLQTTVINTYTW